MTKLTALVQALAADESLPPAARPHKLVGERSDLWDAHVAPDWVLLYEIDEETLTLVRTGTHADLF